jgi:methionyl-tRNA synthetase
VPCEDDPDLKDKVFYVWFDAPIGYLSITGNLVENWEDWWKNPDNVTLYQFMGKDNVTFHTVIFPSSLLGTGDNYTKVNHLSTTEFLNYEGDKFSKSRGVGVFGSNAKDTGIPVEVWRFYLLAIRPETGDTDFYWENFADKVNNELKNNLGNLCHRVFSFINSKFEKKIPVIDNTDLSYLNEEDLAFIDKIKELFSVYTGFMDKVKIKEGLETFMRVSSEGNNYLQKQAPWDVYKKDVDRCKVIMVVLAASIRFIASIAEPFIPSFSAKVYEILNWEYTEKAQTLLSIFNNKDCDFRKEFISLAVQGRDVKECAPLFAPSKF